MSFLLVKSCSEIKFYSPEALSGSYAIDPDGEGGCESIIVFCNMTDKNGTGVTVIGHDSEDRIAVNGYSSRGSYSRAIQYSGVNSSCISQLANLTAVSSRCEQFIQYECLGSVLLWNGSPYGWWVSRDHEKMKYWGGAGPTNSYKCACGVAGQCADRSYGCNCDKERQQMARGQRFSDGKVSPSSHRAEIWRYRRFLPTRQSHSGEAEVLWNDLIAIIKYDLDGFKS